MKLKCERCGKTVNASKGEYTTGGGKYLPPKFFCYRCIKKMERKEHEEKLAKLHEIRELAKQISREHEPRKLMIEVLRDFCPVDGWYKLIDLNERFRVKAGWKHHDVRTTSHILNKLGFTEGTEKTWQLHARVYK